MNKKAPLALKIPQANLSEANVIDLDARSLASPRPRLDEEAVKVVYVRKENIEGSLENNKAHGYIEGELIDGRFFAWEFGFQMEVVDYETYIDEIYNNAVVSKSWVVIENYWGHND